MKLIDQIMRKPVHVAFGRGPSAAEGTINRVALDSTRDSDSVTITADDGSFVVIPGATGTTAGTLTAADKGRLDALAGGSGGALHDFDTKAAVEAASIPAFQEFLRTTGHYAAGDGGGGLYRRVGSQPAHTLWILSADGAYWELVPEDGQVNVLQAGARGDGVTDDAPAIMAAIEAFTGLHGDADQGIRIVIPATFQHYRCASTLNLKHMVRLVGSGFVRPDAQLVFDQDVTGIIINLDDTTGEVIESPETTQSRWSTIQDLTIKSLGGSRIETHGVRLRASAYLQQVVVEGFPGNGISIVASVNRTGYEFGNANRFKLEDCKSRRNGGHGLHVDGNDANAGTVVNFDAEFNGRYGVRDDSFLGNFYFGMHLSGNGNPLRGYNTSAQSCRCSYNGNRYHAVWSATEAQLVATAPGTDGTIWRFLEAGGPASLYPSWTGTDPVGTFFAGGAAAFTDDTARSWVTAYAEGNQAPVYLAQRCSWFGGVNAADAYGDGSWWSGEGFALGDMTFTQKLDDDTSDIEFAIRRGGDNFWRAVVGGDDVQGMIFKWNADPGVFEFRHGNLNDRIGLQFASELTTAQAGTGVPLEAGQPLLPKGVILGSGTNGRKIATGTSAPSSGDHARGEIIFDITPSAGGTIGWVCVEAGIPGLWKAFGAIDP